MDSLEELKTWTPADRRAWSALWTLARCTWERAESLADLLGYSPAALSQWASGNRAGPWPMLRIDLREGARRAPERLPGMVRELATLLFDAREHWVPARCLVGPLDPGRELLEVHGAVGALHAQVIAGLADGAWTAAELGDAREALRQLEEQVSDLRSALDQAEGR